MAIFNEMLGGGINAKDCNATATDILSGKTAAVGKNIVTGTMTNNGAVSKSLNAGASYTIPKGYHNGSGKVAANSLASQNAVAPKGKVVTNTVATGQTINAGDRINFNLGTAGTATLLSSTANSGKNVYAVEIENNNILVLSQRGNDIYGAVYKLNNNKLTLVFEQSIYTATMGSYAAQYERAIHLGNNKVFILLNTTTYGLYITVNSNSITINKYAVVASGGKDVYMCRYSENQICVSYGINSTSSYNRTYLRIITFTDTSFSVGSQATVPVLDEERNYTNSSKCWMISDKKVIVGYYIYSNSRVYTVVYENGSFGNINDDIFSTSLEGDMTMLVDSTDKYAEFYQHYYSTYYYARRLRVHFDGNQITSVASIGWTKVGTGNDDIASIALLYNNGIGFTSVESSGSEWCISYDWCTSKFASGSFVINTVSGDGYSNHMIQTYDGTILLFWNQSASSNRLYHLIVSRPTVSKAPYFSGNATGIALTSGSAGSEIQIAVPYKRR